MPRRGCLSLALLAGAASLVAGHAPAQDEGGRRLVIGVENRIETGRNVGLRVPAEGSTTIASTGLSFGFSNVTPLDRLELSAGFALLLEDSPDTEGVEATVGRPFLTFGYTREVPDALFAVGLRARSGDIVEFGDVTDADEEGTLTEYGVNLRYEFWRTAPASVSVEADYAVADYEDATDPDRVDSDTLTLALGTRLRISPVLTGIGRLEFAREDEEGDAAVDTVTATAGLEHALPNGLASATLTVVSGEEEGTRYTFEVGRALDLPAGALSARIGVSASEEAGADLVGGLDWTQELPDGSFGLSLERSVAFDDDETTVDTSLDVDWTRSITPVSAIGLGFSYEVSDAPSERVEQAEIGATYSRELTRDWRLDGGVRYRVRNDADGHAESPSLFLSLGRSYEFRF
ncbi:MAG: hypothetical protein N2Z62_08935 [Rhodobacteraceae bacterium]|nr:hypothetical protein [Paracoccaceae bacterium]